MIKSWNMLFKKLCPGEKQLTTNKRPAKVAVMSGDFDLEKEMAEAMARVKSKHPWTLAAVKFPITKVSK